LCRKGNVREHCTGRDCDCNMPDRSMVHPNTHIGEFG
jgi:hypothetical protein